MNIIDQCRLIVAERQITLQNRELAQLRFQSDLAQSTSSVAVALKNPMVQLGVMLSLYLIGTMLLEHYNPKRDKDTNA